MPGLAIPLPRGQLTLGDLLAFVRERHPDVVALSATVPSSLAPLREALRALRTLRPGMPILIGGQAILKTEARALAALPDTHCLPTLDDLDQWLARFAAPTPR